MDYSLYPRHDVLCIDMRSFYASVEAVRLGLDPMKVMLAVVGDVSRPGSIVLAASPRLKEKYGISNVSRFYELPHDPDIHIINANMESYLYVSVEITKMLMNYAPKEAIHPYSIDEIWLTVDGLERLFGTPWQIAQLIKDDLLQQFGLTCSIGIGDNKFLAKVVMDLHAKKVGIAECRYEDVEAKLWPAPVEDIWGIGSRMKENLNRMGIIRLGQLAHTKRSTLKSRFGIMGEQLYWHAWGIDLSPVFGHFIKMEQKGFSHGISLLRDYSKEEAITCILDLCEEVCRRARTAHKAGRTIQLSIGYSNASNRSATGFNRSRSIPIPINMTMDVHRVCLSLFHDHYNNQDKIRRIYVSLGNLSEAGETQLDLFADRSKEEDLSYVMDAIRDKYGSTAILRASSYTDAGIALDRSRKIGGHQA